MWNVSAYARSYPLICNYENTCVGYHAARSKSYYWALTFESDILPRSNQPSWLIVTFGYRQLVSETQTGHCSRLLIIDLLDQATCEITLISLVSIALASSDDHYTSRQCTRLCFLQINLFLAAPNGCCRSQYLRHRPGTNLCHDHKPYGLGYSWLGRTLEQYRWKSIHAWIPTGCHRLGQHKKVELNLSHVWRNDTGLPVRRYQSLKTEQTETQTRKPCVETKQQRKARLFDNAVYARLYRISKSPSQPLAHIKHETTCGAKSVSGFLQPCFYFCFF